MATAADPIEAVADRLAADPRVEAVILIGSLARGDASQWSDVDLAVVTNERVRVSELRALLGPRAVPPRLSLLAFDRAQMERMREEGSLFVDHLRAEGKVLCDKGFYAGFSAAPFRRKTDFRDDVREQRAILDLYRDSRRFHGNFLLVLSHLYSVYKNVAILGLAQQGVIEYSPRRVFDKFFAAYPGLRRFRKELDSLRAFHLKSVREAPVATAFSHLRCARRVGRHVRILNTVCRRILSHDEATRRAGTYVAMAAASAVIGVLVIAR